MPVFCPHCQKVVADQPTCANCGKKIPARSDSSSDKLESGEVRLLMVEAFKIVGAIVAVGALCLVAIYFLLG